MSEAVHTTPDNLRGLLGKLKDQGGVRDSMLQWLEEAIALQELWPEVFDKEHKGKVTTRLVPETGRYIDRDRIKYFIEQYPSWFMIQVTRGDGETRTFPLEDCHAGLVDRTVAAGVKR